MIAQLISDGTYQYIKLPKEVKFTSDEVSLSWQGETLQVKPSKPNWQQLQHALALFEPNTQLERLPQGEQERLAVDNLC